MKNKTRPKTVKSMIRSNEKTFIGKRLIFADHREGFTVGVVTNVTKDRVIWVNENNEEYWTWIHPNGQITSFDVLSDGRNGNAFVKAITLEQKVIKLRKYARELESQIAALKDAEKVLQVLKSLNNEQQ